MGWKKEDWRSSIYSRATRIINCPRCGHALGNTPAKLAKHELNCRKRPE